MSNAAPPAPAEPGHQHLALLAGLAVVAVWGANFGVQKALFGVLSPGAFLCARYLLMPLAATLLLLHANGWRWPRLPGMLIAQVAHAPVVVAPSTSWVYGIAMYPGQVIAPRTDEQTGWMLHAWTPAVGVCWC